MVSFNGTSIVVKVETLEPPRDLKTSQQIIKHKQCSRQHFPFVPCPPLPAALSPKYVQDKLLAVSTSLCVMLAFACLPMQ